MRTILPQLLLTSRGSRALLFRSSSLAAARSFAADGVIHPHGNVLSQDAFARGVIRSRTDYEVYTQGIKGDILLQQ